MDFIKDLKNLSKNDVRIAGGKGASLGEMTQVGFSVPMGFVILSNAFEKFLEDTDLNVEIDSILRSVNSKEIHTIEDASEKIKSLILGKDIPKDIRDGIQKYFKKLNAKFIAVRSSATVEDGLIAAWAGQLESYLNATEENLLENIKKCWASLFTPRAIFYRFEKGLDKQNISVAVVVQKMVVPEVSGIAFSVHPITQDANQMVIEAGLGLGEAIVSGQVTPDTYIVEKSKYIVLDKNISQQLAGKEKNDNQKLRDDEILKLAKLTMKIERHYGFPVDIEWAKEKNRFYIIQSRPITTLNNEFGSKQDIFNYIEKQEWFFGVRADESLLFYSAKRSGYDKYIKKEYGIGFAETLLVPFSKKYPIRVFNLRQAKHFHAISNYKILKNPQILIRYIEADNLIYNKIKKEGEKLIKAIQKNNYKECVRLFKKILSFYEIASAQFIIIFSLGLKLTENKDNLKNIRNIIKKHDVWRNSVAFKEEKMGENLFCFFEFLTKQKGIKIAPIFLMKFLTVNEVEAWLDEKLMDTKIKEIIAKRKKHGFAYLNLRGEEKEIIDDPAEIKKIQRYFLKLDKDSQKRKNKNEIIGQTAYNSKNIIKGKVVLIKDKTELKDKIDFIDNKILVAVQTTPHYIPYMKKVKAIITDEGGLTCHAAIVAREFKVPCIVGTKFATQILTDNNLVEVNTKKGFIKLLKK